MKTKILAVPYGTHRGASVFTVAAGDLFLLWFGC